MTWNCRGPRWVRATFIGYTDGRSEAADGRGEQLGTAGVQRLLSVASSDGVAPTDWPAVMLKSLSTHRGGPPEDDTLIVAVCRGRVSGGRFAAPIPVSYTPVYTWRCTLNALRIRSAWTP